MCLSSICRPLYTPYGICFLLTRSRIYGFSCPTFSPLSMFSDTNGFGNLLISKPHFNIKYRCSFLKCILSFPVMMTGKSIQLPTLDRYRVSEYFFELLAVGSLESNKQIFRREIRNID